MFPSGASFCRITERSLSTMSSPLRSSGTPWTCWGSPVCWCTWSDCAWLALPPTAATSRGWGWTLAEISLKIRHRFLPDAEKTGGSVTFDTRTPVFPLSLCGYLKPIIVKLSVQVLVIEEFNFLVLMNMSASSACSWLNTDYSVVCCPFSTRPMSSSSEQRMPGWWTSSRWWWPTASPAPSSSPLVRLHRTTPVLPPQCLLHSVSAEVLILVPRVVFKTFMT